MRTNESKILLSIYEQGGFKPRFGNDKKRVFKGQMGEHNCVKKLTLGPDFIVQALKDPQPAYDLKVLKPGQHPYNYKKLSSNMKINLHVKQFVADTLGIEFGGHINCFEWTLV
jgi:hypothetical protein